MTHIDSVHERFDVLQIRGSGLQVSPWSARLMSRAAARANGAKIYETFGLLYHWTLRECVDSIRATGLAPGESLGVHLTPSRYSPCIAPYRLGLWGARDICLGVNVAEITEIWGPGTAPGLVPVWDGGGLEFYCTQVIPPEKIETVHQYDVCGDPRWPTTS
jgi:hypothetical protein